MKNVMRLVVAGLAVSGFAQAEDTGVYQARRAAVMEAMGDGVAVLYGAGGSDAIVREGFIQDSSFYYLTGVSEPGAALILAPGDHRYNEILYLQRRDVEDEDWNGRRPPLGDALNDALGFEEVTRINRLPRDLTNMLQSDRKAVFLGPVVGATSELPKELQILRDAQARVPGATLENMAGLIAEMRRIKDDWEVVQIQRAVDITGKGILAAMRSVEPGMMEFQLQSILENAYELEGAQFRGFSTILASGTNATVLHYGSNDQPINDSGLVLIDTGAAWKHYTADITRTFPVDGTFSERERELYELVLKASDAAIAKVRVGADHENDIQMTAQNILDEAGYGEYFIHNIGHFVGLDVHDVGDYRRPLKEGVVLTIEPGIYIPEEGIGIRIEDVVLVTKDGPVVLSRHIPRTIDEIEGAMAGR
jgi:Xaa-Pro aminopeptidase